MQGGDRQAHQPPQRGQHAQRHQPHQKRSDRAGGQVAEQPLVDEQQQRTQQHPPQHPRVHAAAAAGHEQREQHRPAQAPGIAQTLVHRHQHPRQQRVGEKRDRGAVDVGDHERVEHEHRSCHEVRDPAPRRVHDVEQAHDPPRPECQQRRQPQALHDPHRQPGAVSGGEERRHREQVAAVLAAEHVPEGGAWSPRRDHLREKARRRDVQVDLRVGHDHARPLDEGQRERHRREQQRHGVAM